MWEVELKENIQAIEPATKSVAITSNAHQMLVLVLGSSDGRDFYFTSATFNGQNLTRPSGFPQRYNTDGIATVDLLFIDISGLATGSYNLSYEVDTGGGPDDGGLAYFLIRGGDAKNLIASSGAGVGNGGNATTNLTTIKPNALLIDVFFSDRNADLTLGTGQTLIFQFDPPGTAGTDRMGCSYKIATTPGAQTMYWTGSSEEWAHGAIAINMARNSGGLLLAGSI